MFFRCRFRVVVLRFLAAAVCCLLLATSLRAGEIELHRQAVVDGAIVRLGDVARVDDPTLSAVALGPRSALRSVTADHVRSRLMAVGRYDDATAIVGASRCELKAFVAAAELPTRSNGQAKAIASERLAAEVKHRVEAAFPDAGSVRVDIAIADAAAAEVAELSGSLRLRGGHANWKLPQPMEVLLPDGSTVRFLATITSKPLVAVAARTLSRGEIVQAGHLELRPASDTHQQPSDLSELVGKQVTRTVTAGDPVESSDVTPVLLVRSGDVVSVSVRGTGFRVTRTMKARSAGGRGDTVTLSSMDNRETMTATVTAYHECEVGSPTADAATQMVPPSIQFRGGN